MIFVAFPTNVIMQHSIVLPDQRALKTKNPAKIAKENLFYAHGLEIS